MPKTHRSQRWWHILVPMGVVLVGVLLLAGLIGRAPSGTVAQGAALVVMCVAGAFMGLGLPILAGLVWAVWAWPRAYRAVPRYTGRVRTAQQHLSARLQRWADRAAQVVMAPQVRGAQVRALLHHLVPARQRRPSLEEKDQGHQRRG